MVEYRKVNVKLSDTQLTKLKTVVENKTGATIRMNFKMFNGNDLPHDLLLTTRQKTKLRNSFNSNMSTDLELSKAQISEISQSGGFLGRLLSPLLKTGLPLIKNVIKPLAKSVLVPLGLTAVASVADAGIHKKILGSENTTLIISNNEMEDIIKIIKYLENSGLLIEGVTKAVQNEVREQKGGFLSILLGTLGASLLGNLTTGSRIYTSGKGKGKVINRAGEGVLRSGYGNKMGF